MILFVEEQKYSISVTMKQIGKFRITGVWEYECGGR
jgi:hypothetical protein